MSYLQQILSGAQQRGGLTDDEFNSIFQQFIPQQPQQVQSNIGLPQQPATAPEMIPLAKLPVGYSEQMSSIGKALGKKDDESVSLGKNLVDQYKATQKYDTDMFSPQTRTLAEEDRGMLEDDNDKMKGLLAGLSDWFK